MATDAEREKIVSLFHLVGLGMEAELAECVKNPKKETRWTGNKRDVKTVTALQEGETEPKVLFCILGQPLWGHGISSSGHPEVLQG